VIHRAVGSRDAAAVRFVGRQGREQVGVPEKVDLVGRHEKGAWVPPDEREKAAVVERPFGQEAGARVPRPRDLPEEGALALTGSDKVETGHYPVSPRAPFRNGSLRHPLAKRRRRRKLLKFSCRKEGLVGIGRLPELSGTASGRVRR